MKHSKTGSKAHLIFCKIMKTDIETAIWFKWASPKYLEGSEDQLHHIDNAIHFATKLIIER